MQAIYISSNQFKVSEDKTSEFLAGRRVRALCGLEYKYSTVQSSTYSSPDTTITLEEGELTSDLSEVHYGIVNIGEQGSFPNHSHNGDEGAGGALSLLTLSDTPSVYDDGKYLRSTISGIEFAFPDDRYYTESEVDTISGTLQAGIDTKVDTEWHLTEGVPSISVGKKNDVAMDHLVGTVYELDTYYDTDSEVFYPTVNGDDGSVIDGVFSNSHVFLPMGKYYGSDKTTFIRFSGVAIPAGAIITVAFVRMTAYQTDTDVTCNLKCYMNNHDNAVAPVDMDTFNALALTTGSEWNDLSSWTDGITYDTISIVSEIQTVVDRAGWSSGNAMLIVIKNNGSSYSGGRFAASMEHASASEKAELHVMWDDPVGAPVWIEKLSPDFLKLSDTPTTYSGGKYLKTTNSGIEFADDLYTKLEVDTISGTLQTDIDGKPDTGWFLTEGVPSISIGKEGDVAVNQEIGTIYERVLFLEEDSEVFYPAVSGDDGYNSLQYGFSSTSILFMLGSQFQAAGDFVRFPNVNIPGGVIITQAYVKFTAYDSLSSATCSVNCYFNNVDNAVAPTNASEFDALSLTDSIAWSNLPAWTNGIKYDTPSLVSILQNIVDREGWLSGNALQVIIKDNGSGSSAYRQASSIDYLSGAEKAELHVSWTISADWVERLSPDFLKLSDTPTTYSGVFGKYLKTTSSGIEFAEEELYTKSEVDTISGSLQTELDIKADIEWFLIEGTPIQSLGKKDDIAVDQETGNIYEKILDAPLISTWNPSDKSTGITLSNGNLTAVSTTEAYKAVRSTLSKSSGKWYWEYTIDYVDGFTTRAWIGVGTSAADLGTVLGYDTYGYSYFNANGNKANNGTSLPYGDAFVTNDIIGVALDLDNGKIWWSRNGVWQASGDPAAGTNEAFSGLSGTFYAMVTLSDADSQVTANFGASSFSYSAPSGFTSGLLEGNVWEERLTPDFLKLSDTPIAYDDGKYLKTTNSGIEFVEDLYTKSEVDTISGTLQADIDSKSEVQLFTDLNDVPTTYSGTDGYYLKTTGSGIEFSEEVNPYWSSVEPFLDENSANVSNKPTLVTRGVFRGYSLPEYATGEEVSFRIRVPFRWDGSTNPWFVAITSISTAEDIGDKYRFQFEWNSKDIENVIPDTVQETLTYEVTVADGTAFYAEIIAFELDSTTIVSGQNLQARLRRIAATSSSVSNEIIVWHWCTRWRMNKLGTESIQGY